MEIDYRSKLYFLIGDPIEKTLSPKLHNYIFEREGINSSYMAFRITDDDLETAIKGFKAMGVGGFNVTIPHKLRVMEYLDEISESAKAIGAVNTVKLQDGKLIGYNTDGFGLVNSIKNRNIDIKNKNVLIIGAGGAALGIAYAIGCENPKSISIANRTKAKGEKLKKSLEEHFDFEIQDYNLSLETLDRSKIDIIINATSVGIYPKEDEMPIELFGFKDKILVYDAIYKPLKSKLLKLAEEKGYIIMNGLDMLIGQGILGQEIWNDRKISEDTRRDLYSIF